MTDAETLAAILDAREPDSHAEFLALVRARNQLRMGVSPADVLVELEAQRDTIGEMAELEREQGVDAVFKLIRERRIRGEVGSS